MRELTIFVPLLPPAVLNPNTKRFWATKAKAARDYSEAVRFYAINARNLWERSWWGKGLVVAWPPLQKARIQLVFTWPLDRRGPLPDADNLLAAFKSGLDALTARDRGNGIVGAGIILDDGPENIEWLPAVIVRGEDPGVKIIVQEAVDRKGVMNN